MTATNRERIKAVLAGDRPDFVPVWAQGFNSVESSRRVMPPETLYQDLDNYPADGVYGFGPHEPAELDKVIAYNRYTDQIATGVGWGANFDFGHAGPGEFNTRITERTPNSRVIEFETGARDLQNFAPPFRHQIHRPVQTIDDVENLVLPDPDDPARWAGFAADAAYFKARGEYTVGWLNGFFSGGHYFFCDYQDFLAFLLEEPELIERLLARLGDWNLRAAKRMVEAGADCIGFCDDLGSSTNMLLSPTLYRRFFLPWHAALAEVVHGAGGTLHMHSHGNITKIMDDIVGSGVDMLNPLDRWDGMDLAWLRERFPKLTLVGAGIDKFLYDGSLDEIAAGLRASIDICGRDGRFLFMDPGGFPEDITPERFLAVREVSRAVRGQPAG